MKRYKVLASYMVYCTAEVEAENQDEAFEMATQMDGGDFKSGEYGDWNIDEIKEIE